MALAWDWRQPRQPNYSHQAFLNSQRPQQGGNGGGMQFNMGGGRLPNLPQLSIPGVAPSPQLPSFDTSFPGLPAPNLPGMQVPGLTTNVSLPQYERPQFESLSGGFQQLQSLLAGLLGSPQGNKPGNAQVSSAISASPLYSSTFAQGLTSSVAGQGNRGLGTGPLPYTTPAQQSALGQQYRTNAQRESGINQNALARQMAGDNAQLGLQSQTARSNSGLGLMDLLAGNWAQDQQLQNTQRNGLLGLLMGMI